VPTFELGATAARHIIAGDGAESEGNAVIAHRLVPRATSAHRPAG
jgi:hypothetical protein